MIGAVWSATLVGMIVETLEGAGTKAGVETRGGMQADFTVTIFIVLAGEAYGDSRCCKQRGRQGRLCLTLCYTCHAVAAQTPCRTTIELQFI